MKSIRDDVYLTVESSLAKYTQDDSHFQRFNPIPEPTPGTPIEEILDQPKRYYEHVADSTNPGQGSRITGAKSATDLDALHSKPLSRSWTAPHGSPNIFPAMIESSLLPGIFHENERRRKRGISGGAGAGAGPATMASERAGMDAGGPGLARYAVREEEEISTADDDSD